MSTTSANKCTSRRPHVDYFGEQVHLAQTGQLYLEAAALALGKVYCFGPTFRAEKSKTRRHLTEFWMVEPEVAFFELPDVEHLAERFLVHIVQAVLATNRADLELLERDISKLEAISPTRTRSSGCVRTRCTRSCKPCSRPRPNAWPR